MPLPIRFNDDTGLIQFAEQFLSNRLSSLENDITLCLKIDCKTEKQQAPFPALLYCFATLDLLGSLYKGHARSRNTVENTTKYMKEFMRTNGTKYQQHQIDLLLKMYRHKIVHLAEPKSVLLYNGEFISWKEQDQYSDKHLQISRPAPPEIWIADIYDNVKIDIDGEFMISILQFKDEIKDSIGRSGDGYLERLRSDKEIRNNFVTAINQIYDPIVID